MDLKVLTQIYKVVAKLTGKAFDILAPKIANAFHQYNQNYGERHGKVKVFCVGMRENRFRWKMST